VLKITKKDLEDGAKNAKRESKHIDFKERIDLDQPRDWVEIIKDIVAMANSGGGCILFGVTNNGDPSGWNVDSILNVDPAKITDKLSKYTGDQISDFEVKPIIRNRVKVAAIFISSSEYPIVFIHPGSYQASSGKQDMAFAQGTIYFRHGAKSEPGNSRDMIDYIDRKVGELRKSWMGNIRKVVEAPKGYQIKVLPPNIIESDDPTAIPIRITDDPNALGYQKLTSTPSPKESEERILPPNIIESDDPKAIPIRITDDPNAPVYQKLNPDLTHPYRHKELVALFNKSSEQIKITRNDVQCVRKTHHIDSEHPEFFYKPKYGSPQFSNEFLSWLLQKSKEDPEFFENAKSEIRKQNPSKGV
jgi:hypothetical protein